MSGVVLRILVKEGDKVQVDQDLVALESMKMEMMVASTFGGVVKKIHIAVEDFVQEGQTLLSVE